MPQPLRRSPDSADAASPGLPFIELQSVESTNNYARGQVHAGLAHHGMAYFAHEQLAGKGQRGKTWLSEKGANIILTQVLDPRPLVPAQQFQLSACVAVALHELFARYAGEDTRIKWPNDLYWQDRKAGGILIESVIGPSPGSESPEWKWALIGTGININQVRFDPSLKNPVSLKQITGREFSPVEMAKELCVIFHRHFQQLITAGFQEIYTLYLASLYKINEGVTLKKGERLFEAVITGVSAEGRLLTRSATGEESFDFGELEWIS